MNLTHKILTGAFTLFLGLSSTFGQHRDTIYIPTGEIREIKDGKTRYQENGTIAFSIDMEKKLLKSYTALVDYYNDSLYTYFTSSCQQYTIYQYQGVGGPLIRIENYKNKVRHGPAEYYNTLDGKLYAKGQFDNWKKVGIWTYWNHRGHKDRQIHWFHHGYTESGISIDYTILPVILTLLMMAGLLLLFIKFLTYSTYYIGYSLLTTGLYAFLIIGGFAFDEITLTKIRGVVSNYVFPVLGTLTVGMILLSSGTMVLRKKAKIPVSISIIFLITGIGLSLLLFYLFVMSKLSGVMLG